MIIFESILAIILIVSFIHFRLTKRKNTYQTSLIAQHVHLSEEMKTTLAMGLYIRFKTESAENPPTYSSNFIKEDPLMFEHFVADLFKEARGGSTWVSPSTEDFGVDFEHRTEEGLFLGQVKCSRKDIPFDPIALIHSNIEKADAKGGYVITTSSFTFAAKQYAKGLDIELIDGVKLVELWLSGMANVEQEIKKQLPEHVQNNDNHHE